MSPELEQLLEQAGWRRIFRLVPVPSDESEYPAEVWRSPEDGKLYAQDLALSKVAELEREKEEE